MKTVLALSGGMDSGTLLFDLHQQGDELHAVTFDYGQRHNREIESSQKLCDHLQVSHQIIQLHQVFDGSALTGQGEIPHGHYAEESMKSTVVPNRNMVMISIAASIALQRNCDRVAYCCHAGDHAIYPDCRPEFVGRMHEALQICDWSPVALHAPYVDMTKRDIAQRAKQLNVPLDMTWTCYEGGELPCGKCGSCVERAEALA
jgi:7-cyano-7-deazaguanine synthase